MRYFISALAAFTLIASGLWIREAVGSHTLAQEARVMRATIYDDGRSCPGGCDSHVVFAVTHNGTRNAFDPGSSRSAPRPCAIGRPCRICFGESEASCMLVTYRGGGPSEGRFDFTPAFYEENCQRSGLPEQVAAQCRSAEPGMRALRGLVNCVANPGHEKCRAVIGEASRRKAADDVLYEECIRLGERNFNRNQRRAGRPHLQRTNKCAYELARTGRNSKGERWHRLLDGACRPGNYAGRDGLDCCTGSIFAAALLDRECRLFFVNP